MKRRTALLALMTCALATQAAIAQDRHPFSVHDMHAMARISDPHVSPDGSRIVFVLRETDFEADRGRTDLWLVNVDGTGLRRLTSHKENDSNPRWTPDGKAVWFLSPRSDSSQVWRIPVSGGEAVQITDYPLDVGSLNVSRDGKRLAVSMEVFPNTSVEETRKKLDEIESRKATGRIYERLFIRHWDQWKDGRRAHVFVLPSEGGEPVDVMKTIDADCPTKPFGGPEDYTFTPAGAGIVLTTRHVGNAEAWSTDFDLYQAPNSGRSTLGGLTDDNEAWDSQPVFSPDGKTLAYRAMSRPRYEADRNQLVLFSWPGGERINVAEDWDRSVGGIVWSPDDSTIYTTAANLGQRSLFAIDVASGEVRTIVRDGNVSWVDVAGDRILFALSHLKSPVELYSCDLDGGNVRAITHINDEKVAATEMGDTEQFQFKGWNDETVYAYVVKPINFKPKRKYPVAFMIHGGPQGSFGNSFHYRWNPQAYAAAGYAVVMVDFHGSTGYGQAFCDSIRDDWGGKPFIDLQKGLAAALKRYPWMDGKRVAALGASYGGYMINWIAGNWPDRFRCLVNHDGNLDERMAYFDTEELWFPEWDHAGTPWGNPEGYEKHNPLLYVDNWKTPMLVIHGALDYRVVDTQGMATFTALQRLIIPSKFLYFPDENHWVLKPSNAILWHNTVLDWLNQWTKK